jgi:hypothetical protein
MKSFKNLKSIEKLFNLLFSIVVIVVLNESVVIDNNESVVADTYESFNL